MRPMLQNVPHRQADPQGKSRPARGRGRREHGLGVAGGDVIEHRVVTRSSASFDCERLGGGVERGGSATVFAVQHGELAAGDSSRGVHSLPLPAIASFWLSVPGDVV